MKNTETTTTTRRQTLRTRRQTLRAYKNTNGTIAIGTKYGTRALYVMRFSSDPMSTKLYEGVRGRRPVITKSFETLGRVWPTLLDHVPANIR